MTKTYKEPIQSSIPNPTVLEAQVHLVYYDGLGRPKQEIAHQMAGNNGDLITHIEYDGYGRQVKEFLPYGRNASLDFDASGHSNVIDFYDALSNGLQTAYPYSETLYENSPLNRVVKKAAPGEDWRMNSGHEVKFSYETNAVNEVHYFGVQLNGVIPSLEYYNTYPAGYLYKTITKDENWKQSDRKLNTTEEFKNKIGQTVLRRTFVAKSGWGQEGIEALDTYYVYDVFGNLTFVLPPKLSNQLPSNGIPSQNLMDALAYQYRYDHRNRMILKKIPGRKQETMSYDILNRLQSVGPVRSPFGDEEEGRIYLKYDKFNREVYTLWYDNPLIVPLLSLPETVISERRVPGTSTVNGVSISYSNAVSPKTGHILTVNYYDDYAYYGAPASIPGMVGENEDIRVEYNQTKKPVGLPTGSWTRILESKTATNAVKGHLLYDYQENPVRTVQSYSSNGKTQTDTKFNFIGQAVSVYTTHQKNGSADPLKIFERFSYNAQSLLLSHTHKIDNGPIITLANNSYDILNQNVQKKIGAEGILGNNPLQIVDYKYNIRGWLTDINNVNNLNQPGGGPVDLFAFKINYNTVTNSVNGQVKELYNGNIAETFWRTAADNIQRKYGYSYDGLNRLTAAYYQLPGTAIPFSDSYSTSYSYDENGNILSLKRNGEFDDPAQVIIIDDLEYSYDQGNQLKKVKDKENHLMGFHNGNAGPNDEYAYDDYGNLIADPYKGIEEITYNHQNLPVAIMFVGGEKIEYTYLADGTKLKKTVTDATNTITTTEYIGGFQYTNETLEFFPHAEGYIRAVPNDIGGGPTNYSFFYVFTYIDHLGNIRLKYTKHPRTGELEILEDNHYYPYGMTHIGYNPQHKTIFVDGSGITIIPVSPNVNDPYKFKFGGKEYQEEFDVNMYDFGARNYDPALGRWMNVDPLAEEMRRHSPYNYAFNNPVFFIDPDGMAPIDPIKMRIFKKTQGNTKGFIVKDFRFTPASNQSWSGTTTTGNITKDSKRSLVIRILQANYGGGERYTRSASVTTTKNKGQYYDDKGEMVDNINNATKVVISEYTITESIDLYEGGVVGKDMNNEITVNESLSTLTFDVLEGGDLSYKEGFHDSTSKTTKIKNASSDLLQIAEKEASKNKAQYNSQEAQRRANYLKGVMEDNYHDAVREYKQDSYVN